MIDEIIRKYKQLFHKHYWHKYSEFGFYFAGKFCSKCGKSVNLTDKNYWG